MKWCKKLEVRREKLAGIREMLETDICSKLHLSEGEKEIKPEKASQRKLKRDRTSLKIITYQEEGQK